MISLKPGLPPQGLTVLALWLAVTSGASWAHEEFSKSKVVIEINTTDGDLGFHVILDADAWKEVSITDPNGHKIFKEPESPALWPGLETGSP